MAGSGADIWGTADEFHYVYRTLVGDGSITALVRRVDQADAWTKAGVMIRESLEPGSPHGVMLVSPGKGTAFQRRVSAGDVTVHAAGPFVAAPYWVRLERAGNLLMAKASADGQAWSILGTDTVPTTQPVYVGLAVTSHADGRLASATFERVAAPMTISH